MPADKQDIILVQRCLDGDSRAFNNLMNKYKRQVFSLIVRLVKSPADAEDILQDTFIKAYRNLASYDAQYPLLTWLFKIAHNTSIDFLRANKGETVTIHDEENPIELEDTSSSLEEKMEQSSEKELIERMVASVPSPYREVLILRHQQELSYEEIAEAVQIPMGTVKVRLFRGREILKAKLEAAGYG